MHWPDEKLFNMLKRFAISLFLFFIFILPASADQLIIEPDMGREPILNLINNTHTSLQLVMYGFTDQTLLQALLKQHSNHHQVQVILEPAPYKAEGENSKTIRAFQVAGVDWHDSIPDVRLIHQKTLLIDQKKALVMTFNFTQSSFKKTRNVGIILTDPNDINDIVEHFNADWNHQPIFHHSPHLIWSPENSRQPLMALIANAKQSIYIYAQQISDDKILGALASAALRDVRIHILTSKNLPAKQANDLTRAGAAIRFSKSLYIHAKAMVIDNQKAVIGSTNLTRASLDNNRELSVITEDRLVIQQLNETFENDWRNANRESALSPSMQLRQIHLHHRIRYSQNKLWNLNFK